MSKFQERLSQIWSEELAKVGLEYDHVDFDIHDAARAAMRRAMSDPALSAILTEGQWIEWDANQAREHEIPVPDDALVDVKFFNGGRRTCQRAGALEWGDWRGQTIVAYRLSPSKPSEGGDFVDMI